MGQLANVFGRRIPLIWSTALFILGSGIAGGARHPAMLIGGRTVQGVRAGGIYVLLDIVFCDLVPLRERGKYLGLMFSWSGLAAALGPVLGGALAEANWRWIFYLNIPICGVALTVILFCMRSRNRRNPAPLVILASFCPSSLGALGWIGFHVQQSFTKHPSVPNRLFTNRTSAIDFALTLLSSILVQATSYFLPIYFQAVKSTTVLRSGINFLPFAIGRLFFAAAAGTLLSKLGVYRPIHATAFGLSSISFGLFTLLSESTSKLAWVFYQLIGSAGAGMILSTLLPAIMAALSEADVASASATYSLIRTFGYIWGVTIPSIVFNGVWKGELARGRIQAEWLRKELREGGAYTFASQGHSLKSDVKGNIWSEVVTVYIRSLETIWWIGLGISLFGFCLVWVAKELELRTELETEYGTQEKRPKEGEAPSASQIEIAVIENFMGSLRAFLDAGVDPNCFGPGGRRLLGTALLNGRLDAVNMLLKYKVNVDVDLTKYHPCYLSADEDELWDSEDFHWLWPGIDPVPSPLMYACMYGRAHIYSDCKISPDSFDYSVDLVSPLIRGGCRIRLYTELRAILSRRDGLSLLTLSIEHGFRLRDLTPPGRNRWPRPLDVFFAIIESIAWSECSRAGAIMFVVFLFEKFPSLLTDRDMRTKFDPPLSLYPPPNVLHLCTREHHWRAVVGFLEGGAEVRKPYDGFYNEVDFLEFEELKIRRASPEHWEELFEVSEMNDLRVKQRLEMRLQLTYYRIKDFASYY
ncbi:MFS general substrate transporter [Aspergillus affinis]|uniref:MFS general substrate transporter n=1 Tax=Aspergillus affinis TaxID=1070780 RepID=UPI0022FEEF00|nr:MFS general substrate transporter [Aspergillus affinis]KAI9039704.1 MFS general substrate transporter [Aspergillus affinis]